MKNRADFSNTRRLIVKIGSSLLTDSGSGLNQSCIAAWVSQMAAFRKRGIGVLLVSSGSVAEGLCRLGWPKRPQANLIQYQPSGLSGLFSIPCLHLSRTRLLLHIVDVNSGHAAEAPATAVKQVISELQAWNAELVGKPRWLVLNKIDLLPVEHMERRCRELVEELRWEGPVFKISALKGDGKKELIFAIMSFLKSQSGQDEEQS